MTDMNSAIPLIDYLNGKTSHAFSYPHFKTEIQQQKIARSHLILYVYFIEPNFLSALKQMLSSTAKKQHGSITMVFSAINSTGKIKLVATIHHWSFFECITSTHSHLRT